MVKDTNTFEEIKAHIKNEFEGVTSVDWSFNKGSSIAASTKLLPFMNEHAKCRVCATIKIKPTPDEETPVDTPTQPVLEDYEYTSNSSMLGDNSDSFFKNGEDPNVKPSSLHFVKTLQNSSIWATVINAQASAKKTVEAEVVHLTEEEHGEIFFKEAEKDKIVEMDEQIRNSASAFMVTDDQMASTSISMVCSTNSSTMEVYALDDPKFKLREVLVLRRFQTLHYPVNENPTLNEKGTALAPTFHNVIGKVMPFLRTVQKLFGGKKDVCLTVLDPNPLVKPPHHCKKTVQSARWNQMSKKSLSIIQTKMDNLSMSEPLLIDSTPISNLHKKLDETKEGFYEQHPSSQGESMAEKVDKGERFIAESLRPLSNKVSIEVVEECIGIRG